MKLLKDLLYSKDNTALDISRLCSLLGVFTFLGASVWHVVANQEFNPETFGIGWTAVCAGCGGWIYARQKWEASDS